MTARDIVSAVEANLSNGGRKNVQAVELALQKVLRAVKRSPWPRWRGRAVATYHTTVSKGAAQLSVRVGGREVCIVTTDGARPVVRPGGRGETRVLWKKHFPDETSVDWSDRRVNGLLVDAHSTLNGRREARAEAGLLRALMAPGKTGGAVEGIYPVTLPSKDGYPLQVRA